VARKTKQEIQDLCRKYNTDRLFSWSRFNKYRNSPYEYFLSYVKKEKQDNDSSSYGVLGNMCHNTLEKYYNKEIEHKDMLGEFNDGWVTAIDIAQLKFDRTDEVKNKNIGDKYVYDLRHFFKSHKPIKYKIDLERFIIIKVGKYVFQGYIDAVYKNDDGDFNIIDFKTSTIYKGKKALSESGQLVLYAEGLHQLGVPLEKIKIGWNFLKYVSIFIQQANGKTNERQIERCKIGSSLKANAKMWLKKTGYEDEIDYYINLLEQTNDIKSLPEEVQEKYKVEDCYVYVDLTQEMINDLKQEIIETLDEIIKKEEQYKTTNDDSIFFDSEESVKTQSYYFANLCGYSANLHKPYKRFLEGLEKKKDNNVFLHDKKEDELDLSWLDEL